jgi:hypothetical protein
VRIRAGDLVHGVDERRQPKPVAMSRFPCPELPRHLLVPVGLINPELTIPFPVGRAANKTRAL